VLVTRFIAGRVARSFGLDERSILVRIAKEAQRQHQARALAVTPAAPPPPTVAINAVYAAWFCGIVAFLLVILNVHLFLPEGKPAAVFKLTVGAILLVEGLALVFERLQFRRLLHAGRVARLHRAGIRSRPRWPRLVGAVLTLLGVVWVAFGVLNVLRGVLEL
jgi:hypothetical protein